MKTKFKSILTLLLIIWGALAFFASCRTRYIPVETIRERVITDTVVRYSIHHQRDTSASEICERIEIRDSVAPVLDSVGRVVAFERWHSSEILRDRSRLMRSETMSADSVAQTVEKSDSIAEQRPVPASSEPIKKRKYGYMIFIILGILIAVGFVGYKVLK